MHCIFKSNGKLQPEIENYLRLVFSISRTHKEKLFAGQNAFLNTQKIQKEKLMISNVFAFCRELLKPINARSKQDAHLSWKTSLQTSITPILPSKKCESDANPLSSNLKPVVFDIHTAKKAKTQIIDENRLKKSAYVARQRFD